MIHQVQPADGTKLRLCMCCVSVCVLVFVLVFMHVCISLCVCVYACVLCSMYFQMSPHYYPGLFTWLFCDRPLCGGFSGSVAWPLCGGFPGSMSWPLCSGFTSGSGPFLVCHSDVGFGLEFSFLWGGVDAYFPSRIDLSLGVLLFGLSAGLFLVPTCFLS